MQAWLIVMSTLLAAPCAHATDVEMTVVYPTYSGTDPNIQRSFQTGVIKLGLEDTLAPKSVANFLTYVNEDFYKNTVFHRVIKDFVVQGGGFGFDLQQKTTSHSAVQNEASNGLKNAKGSLAMARTSDPNSATSQFFINLTDNTSLDYVSSSNPGYTVFGSVKEGMTIVEAIGNLTVLQGDGAANKGPYTNVNATFVDLPVDPVYIKDVKVYPTASAGADQPAPSAQPVYAQSIVALDGTGSLPGSKVISNYAWTQLDCANQPAVCPTVTLNGADSATPQFLAPTVDTPTQLVFQLVITNDDGKTSSADTVTVTVTPRPVVDGTPTANAGVDQTVEPGAGITLDGSASTDPEQPAATLNYKWTQIGTPKLLLTPNGNIAQPVITAPSPPINMVFTFALVVTDSDGHVSTPDTVDITVKRLNHAPVAVIKGNTQVRNQTRQTLDGSGSSDQDNDAITSYQWTQTAGPDIDFDHTAAMPSFVVPDSAIDKDLTFKLVVSDGALQSAEQTFSMHVTSTNHPPTVKLGLDKTVTENTAVTLNSQVQDPDGDCTAYHWERVDSNSAAFNLGDVSGPSLSFTAPPTPQGAPIELMFKLTATDVIATNPPPNCNQTPNPLTASDTLKVTVMPSPVVLDCSQAVASPAVLWPAKGGLINVGITGIFGPNPATAARAKYDLKIGDVTQDEPVINRALGDTSGPDARVTVARRTLKKPLAKDTLFLRAQRQGTQAGGQAFSGNGRVYKVGFSASDGNDQCTGEVTVSVPPAANGTATDDGQNYQSRSRN